MLSTGKEATDFWEQRMVFPQAMESLIFLLFLEFLSLSSDISKQNHLLQVPGAAWQNSEPWTQGGPSSPRIPRVASNSFLENSEYPCLIMFFLILLLYVLLCGEWGCSQFKWFVTKSRIHFLVSYPWLSLDKRTFQYLKGTCKKDGENILEGPIKIVMVLR